jgi:hypothetical protein
MKKTKAVAVLLFTMCVVIACYNKSDTELPQDEDSRRRITTGIYNTGLLHPQFRLPQWMGNTYCYMQPIGVNLCALPKTCIKALSGKLYFYSYILGINPISGNDTIIGYDTIPYAVFHEARNQNNLLCYELSSFSAYPDSVFSRAVVANGNCPPFSPNIFGYFRNPSYRIEFLAEYNAQTVKQWIITGTHEYYFVADTSQPQFQEPLEPLTFSIGGVPPHVATIDNEL